MAPSGPTNAPESGAAAKTKPSSTPSPSFKRNDSSSEQRNEVDYYLNPTELFRWINYRRWDGAKARALSHPEECSTWIVSRHNTDGRVLWRHLPLHLVCMQIEHHAKHSSVKPDAKSQTTRSIEDLVDVLLEAYPEAASSPDDQGLLPLHLVAANSTHPNERILYLLLLAYPTGVSIKDQYGRTPADLLEENAEPGPAKEGAMRALARANNTTIRLADALREESESKLFSIQQTADNERLASQQIILRLEQELAETKKHFEQLEEENRHGNDKNSSLHEQLKEAHEQLEEASVSARATRRALDDLKSQNEVLQQEVEDHDHIMKQLHQEFEDESQAQADTIATLRSEVSTAKAMVEALENQMRSRFTNEEYLANAVSDLEKELADAKVEYQQIHKKLTGERDSLQSENTQLARSVDDLTKKNEILQTKVSHFNQQVSAVMRVHTTFNAEHDRMMDANLRVETELLENMRNERSRIAASMKEQLDVFKTAVKEQESMLEDCERSEMELLKLAKAERDKSIEAVSKLRRSLQESRLDAVDCQRGVQNENVVPSRPSMHKQSKTFTFSRAKSVRKSPSPSYSSQSPTNGTIGSTNKESRTPSSTKMAPHEHGSRQGSSPSPTPTSEGKLVQFLNAMAEKGVKHDASLLRKDDVSSLESSTMIGRQKGSVRFADKGTPKPQMVGLLDHHDDDSSSHEDSNIARSLNSDIHLSPRKASNFFGNFHQLGEFDNENSSKETVPSKSTQYSRLSEGMRHGMFHIHEESVEDGSASQYRETVALH